jgi:hypothetical protein
MRSACRPVKKRPHADRAVLVRPGLDGNGQRLLAGLFEYPLELPICVGKDAAQTRGGRGHAGKPAQREIGNQRQLHGLIRPLRPGEHHPVEMRAVPPDRGEGDRGAIAMREKAHLVRSESDAQIFHVIRAGGGGKGGHIQPFPAPVIGARARQRHERFAKARFRFKRRGRRRRSLRTRGIRRRHPDPALVEEDHVREGLKLLEQTVVERHPADDDAGHAGAARQEHHRRSRLRRRARQAHERNLNEPIGSAVTILPHPQTAQFGPVDCAVEGLEGIGFERQLARVVRGSLRRQRESGERQKRAATAYEHLPGASSNPMIRNWRRLVRQWSRGAGIRAGAERIWRPAAGLEPRPARLSSPADDFHVLGLWREFAGRVVPVQVGDLAGAFLVGIGLTVVVVQREVGIGARVDP